VVLENQERSPQLDSSIGTEVDELLLIKGPILRHFFRVASFYLFWMLLFVGITTWSVQVSKNDQETRERSLTCLPPTVELYKGALGAPPQCFKQPNALFPASAIAAFAQGLNDTGGVLTNSTPELVLVAAQVCAPILASLSVGSSPFTLEDVPIQKLFRFAPASFAYLRPTTLFAFSFWSLFLALLLFLIEGYFIPKRLPVPRPVDCLRLLFHSHARQFMMSYKWDFPSPDRQRARVLAQLLPDCWLDVQALPAGSTVSSVIQQQAVHARCLVVYGTLHYFASKNCLRELLAALIHRRPHSVGGGREEERLSVALLLDTDKSDVVQLEPGEKKLLGELGEVLSETWKVDLFRSLKPFWQWVAQRASGSEARNALEWFRKQGKPRTLALTYKHSHLVRSEALCKTGLCVRVCLNGEPCRVFCSYLCASVWQSCGCSERLLSRRRHLLPRFGMRLYGSEEVDIVSCLGLCSGPTLFFYLVALFTYLLLRDLSVVRPGLGGDSTLFVSIMITCDTLSLASCILVLLPAALIRMHQARPATNYSNFLEPLCIISHLNAAMRETGTVARTVPLREISVPAPICPFFIIYFACGPDPLPSALRKHVGELSEFLKVMGLDTKEIKISEVEDKLSRCRAAALLVYFLSTEQDSDNFLKMRERKPAIRKAFELCTIPVVFDDKANTGGMKDVLFLDIKVHKDELGGEVLRALSKRVAIALLSKPE
jgi:hypothetical protein